MAKNFKTDAWIEKIVIVGMQWKPEHTTLRLNSGNDSCRCSYRTMTAVYKVTNISQCE